MRTSMLVAIILMLAAPAVAQQDTPPLNAQQERDAREAILQATLTPDFEDSRMLLEVYRTLRAAGVTLSPAETFAMGEQARLRGLPGEAAQAFALLSADDEEFRQNIALIDAVRRQAEYDRDRGLERSAEAASRKTSGEAVILVAEAFAGHGNYGRAIELYLIGLAEGQPAAIDPAELEARAAIASKEYRRAIEFYRLGIPLVQLRERFTPTEMALGQLNLGIAQFRLNQIDAAQATWLSIAGNTAVAVLAKIWIDLARSSAN